MCFSLVNSPWNKFNVFLKIAKFGCCLAQEQWTRSTWLKFQWLKDILLRKNIFFKYTACKKNMLAWLKENHVVFFTGFYSMQRIHMWHWTEREIYNHTEQDVFNLNMKTKTVNTHLIPTELILHIQIWGKSYVHHPGYESGCLWTGWWIIGC